MVEAASSSKIAPAGKQSGGGARLSSISRPSYQQVLSPYCCGCRALHASIVGLPELAPPLTLLAWLSSTQPEITNWLGLS